MIGATAWGRQPRYLIRDRSYGGNFVTRARRIGIETVLTPIQARQANANAERLIGTLRRECLDYVIVVNERHLSHVLAAFVRHYNESRPNRSLALEPPRASPPPPTSPDARAVRSRSVLNGLVHEYELAA